MNSLFDLVPYLSQDADGTISALGILVRVTAILALGMLIALSLRRASAALRHWVWVLSLFAVILLPIGYGVFPSLHWAILPPQQEQASLPREPVQQPLMTPVEQEVVTEVAPPRFDDVSYSPSQTWEGNFDVTPRPMDTPAAVPAKVAVENVEAPVPAELPLATKPAKVTSPSPLPWSWSSFLAVLWGFGTALGLAWLIIGVVAAWHITRRAKSLASSDWSEILQQLTTDCGFRRPVTVRESRRVSVPMTWGLRRPMILVPAGSGTWSEATKRSVLLHELGHIRRGDCLTRLLGRLACVVYWFHPLAWLADRQLRKTSEQAADDAVLASNIAPPDYAEQLLGIVAQLRSNRLFGHVVLPMASKSDLEGRMLAILDPHRNRRVPKRKTCYALIVLATLALIPCAMLRLGYAENNEAQEQNSTAKASDVVDSVDEEMPSEAKPFTAQFPCGVEVELLGISEHPSKDTAWWRPDGSPLSEPPCDPFRGNVNGGPGYVTRKFALQFRNQPPEPVSTQIKFDPAYNGYASGVPKRHGEKVPGLNAMTVSLPDQETVTMRVRMAAGPWKTVTESQDGSESMGSNTSGFAFSPVIENNDGVSITVSYNINGPDCRLIAVDTDGREHTASSHTGGGSNGFNQLTATFAKLSRKDIKVFRLQTRSYEQIEFHNVSLHPSQKNKVQIEPLANDNQGKPNATTASEIMVKDIDSEEVYTERTLERLGDPRLYPSGVAAVEFWIKRNDSKDKATPSDPQGFLEYQIDQNFYKALVSGTLINSDKNSVLPNYDEPKLDFALGSGMEELYFKQFSAKPTTSDGGTWQHVIMPIKEENINKALGKRALDLKKQDKYISRLQHGITVAGHVLDFENKPIQGATVSVAPKTYCTDKDKEVKTDAKGYFQIEHCPLGFIVVTIQADGFAPQFEKLQSNGDVFTLKAQLKPGVKICGRVVDLQKNPLKDVHVAVASWQGIRTLKFRTKTDEEGRFVWESAPHDIVNFDFFGAKGFMAERNRPLASFSEEQTIYLNPELVIRGTVTDEATGEPIKPIRVCLGRRSKGMPELDFSNGLRYEKNDNQYELRVNEPTPGIYVKIEADGYQPTTSREFKPNEGEQTYDFKLKKNKTKAKSTAEPTIAVTPKTVVQSDTELSPVERSQLRWEVADEFQKSMKGKRFQEAVVHFAPELKKELPAAELEKLWRKLVGPQGEIHYSRVRRAKRFGKIWLQSIQFDAMAVELETLLAFDEQNRINGLRIVCNKGRQKFPDFPERGYMFGDAIKEATHANLTLKAIVVGLDGKPIEDDEKSTEEATSGGWKMQKRRASIWMAAEREVDDRRDHHWRDPVTGKLWRWIGSGEEKNLSPGLYRAVALPQRYSNSPPPIGMSEVVELDGSQKHTEVNVPMKTGPTLSLKCVDAKTGKPSEPVHVTVINTSGHLPPDTRFGVNEKVSSIKLENMLPGTYTVTANTRVSRPDEPQYRLENGPMKIEIVAGQDQEITLPIIKALMTEEAIAQRWRWVVQGRVTDEKGQPVEGASVWVHSGYGTCFRTGITETGKDGQYTLRFGPGAMMSSPKPGEVPIGQLVASVSVHKPGFTEKNLSRQGGRSMANRLPTPEEEKLGASTLWGKTKPILPNDPVTIDFVMVPAATVDVELVDAEGKPVSAPEKSLGLSGETRPPGCSVLKSGEKADGEYFHVEDVPPDYAWWFYLNTEPRKKIRTPEMTFSQAETYRVQLQTAKRASDDEYLEVVSVKNAQGEDVREQVLAGNTPTTLRPSTDKAAPPELVETMRKTNRPWLKPDPKHLSYTFAMEHPGEDDRKEYKVQYASSGTASIQEVGTSEKLGYSRVTMLQGTSMFGPLQAWALSPKDSHTLTVVGEATIDGVDAWVLHLKNRQNDSGEPQRFSVAVGCGLARTWYGYSSYKVDLDQIWVDKATGRILREEAFTKKDGFYQKKPSFVATYGDFEKTPDGGQAPRQVEVQLWSNPSSAWVFKMQFRLVDGKTWLLKELEEIQGGKLSAIATVSDATADSLADPVTIIEGVGWGGVRVGITRESLIKALGKPDGDPNSSILRWSAKHLECTFHVGSTVVSEVRFNQGFREALSNGIKLGAPGHNVLKEYGEPEHVIDPRNGAKEYEYSSKGILFWTNQGKVTQIVVFKPYHLKKKNHTSPKPVRLDKGLAKEYQPLPNDEKLTEEQRLYCRWDAKQFGVPTAKQWEKLSEVEKAKAEEQFLKLLKNPNEAERVGAIDALVGLGSKKAVAPILEIAADRKEKNNWDRHTACRALGMLGDKSVVPELVHLTYHFNWNTRLWAQISLVRLTGQNFGNDVKAWKAWWDGQGGQPPISEETVAWATSQWMLAMLKGYEDPAKQKEYDRHMIKTMKQRLGETSPSSKPTSPDPKEEAAPKTSQTSTKPKNDTTEPPPVLLTALGKVLDPAGKPVAGATVYLREWSTYRVSSQPYLQDKKIDDILAKTQTDAEGKFEFKNVPAKPLSSQWLENIPWDVVVEAKPYALAWQHLSAAKQSEPMTITLVADQEITGQVTDQQGMPVPDAKVEVFGIAPVGSGPDCSAYADPEVLDLQASRITPVAKTDDEGKVSLPGVPKNKQVRLRVAHDDFCADVIYVATTNESQSDLETSSFNYQTRKPITKSKKIFSNDFSVALEPPLPRLVGRIVAADTKKPLSQINISQYGSNGVLTDQDGQFTLKSIRGKNCRLLILAPKAGNYLGRVLFVDVPDDKKETRIDIELERGENLSGMVVDEETGKGVANVYVGFETDYDLNTATEPGVLPTNYKTGNDGRFRLTVPPVEGKVKIFGSELGYDLPRPSGNPEDIEGFFREVEVIAGKPTEEIKFTLRRLASEEKKKTPLVRRDYPGQYLTKARKPVNRMVEGKVIDPDGKPVAGALVGLEWGMNHLRENDPLVQSDQEGAFSFKLKRDPYQEENLVAIDQKRKLRGHVRISNPSQEEKTNTFWEIYLVPTGVVKGRVMEGDEPLADAEVQLDARALRKDSRGNWPLTSYDRIRTDKDGYFEFPLVEGDCQIDLHVHPEGYTNATCQGELAAGGTFEPEPFTVMKLDKTVGGTVVDPDGKPVEGVTVTAEPYSNPTIHHQAWNRNATGKDGRFVIHGVPDVPLTLNAHIRLDGQVLRNSVQTKAEPGTLEVKIVFDPK